MADQNLDPNKEQNVPQPGTPEHDQMMAEKYRNQGQQAEDPVEKVPVPPMPEWGLEKFYDKETGAYNYEAHIRELNYRMEQNKKPKGIDKDQNSDPNAGTGPDGSTDQEVQDIIQRAGLSIDELEQQILNDGQISDEARAALNKQGIPDSLIDSYVTLAQQHMERSVEVALDYVGGEEEWQKIRSWAERSLSDKDKQRFNEQLASEGWKDAIDALRYRMSQSSPTNGEPSLVTGGGDPSGGQAGYRSRAEMKADMANPEYRTNPAFRQKVMQKMANATWDLDGKF